MKRSLYALLGAQFLSAFADNAALFAAIAMILQAGEKAPWYVPALQSSFLVAFVLLAPWVGPFADKHRKPTVLIIGNLIKMLGVSLILVGIDPLIAYAVIGTGAAIYGPAKYGILPELVPVDNLVKANGWIEGSTILAIVMGTVVGARLADMSVDAALWMVVVSYALSILVTLLIGKVEARGVEAGNALPGFYNMMHRLFVVPRARFAMLGASLFWGSAAVLRVIVIAWAPLVLLTQNTADIAELTLFMAIGIVAGAALVPKLIPLQHLHRARIAAYLMGVLIFCLSFVDSLWPARAVLFFAGVAGGLFVVPINAALQSIGHRTIGSGGAVAIQQFFENLAMLACVGSYTWAAANGAQPVASIFVLGIVVVIATALVSWRLPKDLSSFNKEMQAEHIMEDEK